MTSEHSPEVPRHETSPQEVGVTWKNLDNDEVPQVVLRLGESAYSAQRSGAGFLAGKIEVPEEDRRKGIGSQLVQKLVEIARTEGITQITHFLESEEGLLLITNTLPLKDRKYYDPKFNEISFEEALAILKQKKEAEKQDDGNIAILTDTHIDQLET